MTEQSVDVAEASVDKEPTFTDEMQKMVFEKLVASIKERNSLVGQANAANGDREAITEDVTENSDDPQIIAARELRDQALAQLEALVSPLVETRVNSAGEGLGAIEESLKEIDAIVKPGVSYYKKLYSDEAAAFLPKQARLKGMTVSNAGSGGSRIRGYNLIVTAGGVLEEFENFASASKWLGLDTAQLQAAFFEAIGGKEKLKTAADKVSFNVSYTETDEDGQSETLEATVAAYKEESDVEAADVKAELETPAFSQ